MIIRFSVSPEQEDVIADHLLFRHELGMQPDERAWIHAWTQKLQPGARILKAELDVSEAEWIVEIEPKIYE
jgi:hypothetical protein